MVIKSYQINMIKKLTFILLFVSTSFAQSKAFEFFNSFADIAEEVNESVVTITTTNTVQLDRDVQNFYRYWGREIPDEYESKSLGSGVIVDDKNAYIVTNHHVIFDERSQKPVEEIKVQLLDKRIFEATVIGLDKATDLAVLQIEADDIKAVDLGDSEAVRVGEWVIAIGSPFSASLSHTVTAGIVSALGRNDVMNNLNTYQNFIQTDAAINRGNSGGPLFNMDGEVVGVNTAILSPNGGSIGIGFSMASNVVEPVVKQLKEFGEVRRGWLGVSIGDLNQDMADALGMKEPSGSIVLEVYDGPSKDAGLLASDVIVMFDNKEVGDSGELVRIVGDTTVGRTVDVIVLRQGERIKVSVKLGQRPTNKELNAQVAPPEPAKPNEDAIEGAGLSELTDSLREEYGIDSAISGVIIMSVDETSSAYENGLRKGDVITDVAQKPIGSVEEVEELISSAKSEGRQSVLLLVRREGQPRFIVLKFN